MATGEDGSIEQLKDKTNVAVRCGATQERIKTRLIFDADVDRHAAVASSVLTDPLS